MDKECDWRTSSGKVFQFFGAEIRKARDTKELGCDVEVLITCRSRSLMYGTSKFDF